VSDGSGTFAKWRVLGVRSGSLEGISGGLGRDSRAEEVRGWAERVLECGGLRRFGVISARGEGLGGGGAAVGLAGSTKEAERSGKLGIWRGARLRLIPSAIPSADRFGLVSD
jgi:hypothetical protein